MIEKPTGITVFTKGGFAIPCDVRYEEPSPDGLPRFCLIAESIDWRRVEISRVEIEHWPGNSVIGFDLKGWPKEQAAQWISGIQFVKKGTNLIWSAPSKVWDD